MLEKQATLNFTADAGERNGARILIGCAGWSLPGSEKRNFPKQGTHLERYAAVFPAVEINSSFYRPHRAVTYARWRDSVPDAFRFSVKMPRTITHHRRLHDIDDELHLFLGSAGHLEKKLGCLLVQLPPSLKFDPLAAPRFFEKLRSLATADIVCEPRHVTWFAAAATDMFASLGIARVLADPPAVENPDPALHHETVYIRLHGSPVVYHSSYSDPYLQTLSAEIAHHVSLGRRVWCIFDNTASGAAASNALSLLLRTSGGSIGRQG